MTPNTSAALALAALLAQPALAQQFEPAAPSAASLFPSSTMAIVEFRGLEACSRAAEEDPLLGFIRQRAADVLGADPAQMLAGQVLGQLEAGLEQVGIERRDVRDLLRGRIAIGASRLNFFEEDDPFPSLAIAIEAPAGRAAVATRVTDRLLDLMMQEAGPRVGLRRSTRTVLGTQMDVIKPEERLGSIARAMVGDWMVLTSNESFLVDIVQNADGGSKTLAQAKGLGWARASGGESLLSTWLNVGPFFDALGLLLPYEADPILAALGLQRLNGIMLDYSALPGGVGQDTLSISADHTESGLLAALLQGDLDMSVARYFPDTAFAFGTMNVDVQKILAAGQDLLEALPANVRAEIQEGLEEADEELAEMGMTLGDIRNTAAQFGNQIALGVNLSAGAIPDGLIYVGTRRSGFADRIASLAADFGVEVGEQTLDEIGTVRWLNVPDLPIRPTFAEVDGGLLFGTSPNVVKGAIRRAMSGEGALTSVEDFQAQMQPNSSVAGWFHLRLKEVGSQVYANALPFIRAGLRDEFGDDLPPGLLPEADELEQILEDVTLELSRDRGGIRIQGRHQLTTAQILSWVGGLIDQVMSTDLAEVR